MSVNTVLTERLRPKTFDELLNNETNKKIMKAILKDPMNAPRTLIFGGKFGSGKTTSARMLARMLNDCPYNEDVARKHYYHELDASVVGNKEGIKQYSDLFLSTIKGAIKVVVIDEIHAASKAAQTLLLKTLEEVKPGIFFILCTTDCDKIIPTIRSRSLELTFPTQPMEDVSEYVKMRAEEDLNVAITQEISDLIAYNSGGHMRNAIMELNKYVMLGKEDYIGSSSNTMQVFCDMFSKANKGEDYLSTINLSS